MPHPQPPPADWYTWLRRAGLDPPVARECAALLHSQELETADAPDFDHDLLRTAGVAIAKHRLQILRLARDEARTPTPLAMLRGLVSAAAGRVASWCRRPGSGSTTICRTGPAFVPPKPTSPLPVKACWGARGSERWIGDSGGSGVVAGLLRPTRKRMLMLAGASRAKVAPPRTPLPSLPLPFRCASMPAQQGYDVKTHSGSGCLVVAAAAGPGASDSTPDEQEVGWDALFSNMKPT